MTVARSAYHQRQLPPSGFPKSIRIDWEPHLLLPLNTPPPDNEAERDSLGSYTEGSSSLELPSEYRSAEQVCAKRASIAGGVNRLRL
jgi:hypothetical protein